MSILDKLKRAGWNIEYNNIHEYSFARYSNVPDFLINFLSSYSNATSKDETEWFLSSNDFSNPVEDEFSFDEYEKMSLEAASDDLDWQQDIIKFWDHNLPIYMSVSNGYKFIAFDTIKQKFVQGCEPEFEETEIIGDTLECIIKTIT